MGHGTCRDAGDFHERSEPRAAPAGRFVALTVNARHYVSWAARLLHLLPHRVTQELIRGLYGRSHHDTFPTHYRLNTVKELRHTARSNGLVLESVVQYANPGYFAFWQPLWRAAVVADRCLDWFSPGLGRLYLVVTLRKKDVTGKESALD